MLGEKIGSASHSSHVHMCSCSQSRSQSSSFLSREAMCSCTWVMTWLCIICLLREACPGHLLLLDISRSLGEPLVFYSACQCLDVDRACVHRWGHMVCGDVLDLSCIYGYLLQHRKCAAISSEYRALQVNCMHLLSAGPTG